MMDAAYWRKGCSSLGRLRVAVLVAIGKGKNERHCLMDVKEAITAAKKAGAPLSLLVKNGDHFKTVDIDYHDGLRYPRLERIEGTPDLLSAIYTPKK